MDAVDRALYAKLSGDATLAALCTDGVVSGQIFNGQPPQGTTPHYLMFAEESGADTSTWTRRAAVDLTYMVKAVARKTATTDHISAAKTIRERADALITDTALTVTGWKVGRHRRASLFGYEENDGGVIYYHAGFRWRIRLIPLT